MKVLVFPHTLELGGSQLNAIEIAAAVARAGHEVVVFARPGPLQKRIDQLGLELVVAPEPGRRPSPAVVASLAHLVRHRRFEVLHGYEWPPILESCVAAARSGAAATGTIMSMSVAPFVPRSMHLVVGTEQIAHVEGRQGRSRVHVLEPPVDTAANRAGQGAATKDLAGRLQVDEHGITIVTVTRLAHELKSEGLVSAIRAVQRLADLPVTLVVVGDGPARQRIEEHARSVNGGLGRNAVILAGELLDPRPAYDLADIVLGMGGSALRGMAFGKPLIVQGERGFFEMLSPETAERFQWAGWYGAGESPTLGPEALERIVRRLAADQAGWPALGRWGRRLVEERYSLENAAQAQLRIYRTSLEAPRRRVDRELLRSGAGYLRYQTARRVRRVIGIDARDDFNARPVAAHGPPRVSTGARQ